MCIMCTLNVKARFRTHKGLVELDLGAIPAAIIVFTQINAESFLCHKESLKPCFPFLMLFKLGVTFMVFTPLHLLLALRKIYTNM